jgi:mannose-1-phosphate guanylyltransferase/phosphomannomutase
MCGVEFIRTKTSQKDFRSIYKQWKTLSRRDIINSYLITLDAVGIVMFTLNLMANSNITLYEIMSKFPKYYKKNQEVLCPGIWKER